MFGRQLGTSIVIGIALLALAFGAGCKKSTEKKTATPTASTSKSAATTTAKTDSGAGKSNGAGGGDAGEFAQLLEKYQKAESHIDYSFSGAGMPGGTGTMSFYQSKDRMRVDFSDPSTGSVIMIMLPDKSYMCMSDQKMCLETPGGANQNPAASVTQQFGKNASNYTVKRLDNRKIAGIDARCFEYSGPGGDKGVTCVSNEGQLLLIESTVQGQAFKMEATKASGSAKPADFEPPYPVQAMPSFGR